VRLVRPATHTHLLTLVLSALCAIAAIAVAVASIVRAPGIALVLAIAALVIASVLGAFVAARLHTLKRDAAELEHLARNRADQVSVLAHEVRTPLAVIRGSAELLAEGRPGPLTERQVRFLRTILGGAETLSVLSEQLLVEARIDAGIFSLRLEWTELRTVVRESVDELRGVHGHRIVLDAPGPPVSARIDAQLIKQVVINLVSNAVRHSDDDRVVTVRLSRSEDDVTIAVSDDGAGMSVAERQSVFTRNFSGERSRDSGGSGIGLYISRQIIELHQGRIYLDTLLGRGTDIVFTLPIEGPR
jgi:two-component system OmpR family sensor kinase